MLLPHPQSPAFALGFAATLALWFFLSDIITAVARWWRPRHCPLCGDRLTVSTKGRGICTNGYCYRRR